MASPPITMKSVAERAGVSLMSVSRALRSSRGVSVNTRKRILKIADELGYRPNPLVGALMVNLRTARVCSSGETLAFVTAHPEKSGWRRGLTARYYFAGAKDRAARLGFQLEEFWLAEPGMTSRRMSQILRTRNVAGVLLAPLPNPDQAPSLRWEYFAPVALGYSMNHDRLHRVSNHHIHSIRLALTELQARGYRRIGLVHKNSTDKRADDAWTTGIIRHHAEIPSGQRVPPHIPRALTADNFWRWFEKFKPDVILGDGKTVRDWLEAKGVGIPSEVGVATLEYYTEYGNVAGVDQNSELIGAAGVDLVVGQLYHNERGLPRKPKVVMIEGEWRDGPTVHSGTGAFPKRT